MDDIREIIPIDISLSDDETEVMYVGSVLADPSVARQRVRGVGLDSGLLATSVTPSYCPLDDLVDSASQMRGDLAQLDLCDTDMSDVEILDINGPAVDITSQEDPAPIPNTTSHTADIRLGPMVMSTGVRIHNPDVMTLFAQIHERLRTQALLLERMQIFAVDTRPRIPPSVILRGLPIRRIGSASEAAELGACPICLESYKARMLVRELPKCGHLIHKSCMDKWITKSHRMTCPLDNFAIEVEDSSSGHPSTRPTLIRASDPSPRSSEPRRSSRLNIRRTD
jgi:hypothetical protein